MKTWMSLVLLSAATAGTASAHPHAAPVPPTMEIEILDPNVDPQGLPAVVTRPGLPGEMRIDIPPTVLVHRYYYTGDRSFQARMLPGGPCIVVASHPRTGERLYINVQMIPGAPRVTYTNHKIQYDYGHQVITIHFCHSDCSTDVVYSHGQPVGRNVATAAHASLQKSKALFQRTGIPDATRKACEVSKQVGISAVDGVRELTKAAVAPLAKAVQLIPGVNALTPTTLEDQAGTLRNQQIQRAMDKRAQLEGSLPTNR